MAKYKLGDICEIVSGSTPKTGVDEYWDGDIKWITPAELNDDTYIITDSVRKITELAVKKTGLSPFPEGTVILSSRAPIGKVAIAGCEMYCNQGFKNLICSDKINNRYLYWFLKGNTKYLNSIGRGATFKEISKSIVSEIEINVPDLNEQAVAVANLEKISKIIALRRQELSALDDLIKARFVELFSLGEFPQVTIAELVSGKVQSVKKVFSPDDEIKYIDISSIDNKRNVMTGYTEYILSEAPSRAQQHIKKGDIVISTVRPNLRNVAMTEFEDDNLVASSGFCVLRASKCLPEYLLAIVCSDKFTDDMTKVVTGANYPAIKDSDIMGYYVSKPPMELQVQFATFVHQVDKSKAAVKNALDQTKLLFDSLMQQYFG